jgi:multicomponent Na+:H+ antiporter subunit G
MTSPLALVVDVISGFLVVGGALFVLVGMIGLVRMPDVFTRMHAASVTDTLGAGMLLVGLMLQAGPTLVAAKLLFILVLLIFTGPVVSHALAQAALQAGVEPLLSEDRRDRPPAARPGTAAGGPPERAD